MSKLIENLIVYEIREGKEEVDDNGCLFIVIFVDLFNIIN